MSDTDVETILRRLIGFETVSASSNNDLCDYIVELLEGFGVEARRFPDATGTKSAVLATIGDSGRAGIVLSAHTDVVPAVGQAWSSPPFEGTRVGDKIVGRGASDMKGFVACVLASVPHFKANCARTPVHLAFSYDEEVGCKGAGDLVAALSGLPARPALCLVGEPTAMRIGRAHKGKIARRIEITGRGGHSALPHRAASALDAIVSIAAHLRGQAEALESETPDSGFDPPYTTLHIGSITSGGALNLVPDHAKLEYEIRFAPGTDTAALLTSADQAIAAAEARLRAKAPEGRIVVAELLSYPGLATAEDAAALKAVARWAGDDQPSITLSFGTEGGLYAAAGIPTIVCGPGDIGRAHKADEWIGRSELADACAMLERLAGACREPAAAWLGTTSG